MCGERSRTMSVMAWRRSQADEVNRAARAPSLVQTGELSAARQALEEVALAPGNLSTLSTLTDPERRPQLPRQPLSEEVIRTQHVEQFALDSDQFLLCLRKTRRGAAPGPSSMTSDHLFPLTSSEGDVELFSQEGSLLANWKCHTPSSRRSDSADSQRSVNQLVLYEGSSLGTSSEGLSPEQSPNRSPRKPRQPQLPSSTRCRRKQAVSVLRTFFSP